MGNIVLRAEKSGLYISICNLCIQCTQKMTNWITDIDSSANSRCVVCFHGEIFLFSNTSAMKTDKHKSSQLIWIHKFAERNLKFSLWMKGERGNLFSFLHGKFTENCVNWNKAKQIQFRFKSFRCLFSSWWMFRRHRQLDLPSIPIELKCIYFWWDNHQQTEPNNVATKTERMAHV